MAADLDRVELYLDGARDPAAVAGPPFRVRLDTRELADGSHRLRATAVFRDGTRRARELSFEVENRGSVQVDGLDEGATVSGVLDLGLLVGQPSEPLARRAPRRWAYGLATAVVLGGVWALFTALSPVGDILAPAAAAGPSAAAVALFRQHCATCHGDDGKGTAAGKALGAPDLTTVHAPAAALAQVVSQGRGNMPAFASTLTPRQIREVVQAVGALAAPGGG